MSDLKIILFSMLFNQSKVSEDNEIQIPSVVTISL